MPINEVQEFKAWMRHGMDKRKELRQTLRKIFDELCVNPPQPRSPTLLDVSVISVRVIYIFKLELQEIVDLILESLICYNMLTLLTVGYYDMFMNQNVRNGTVLQEHAYCYSTCS
jgi:hypothetical protein